MARTVLHSVTTKLYDQAGRHVADRVDQYFIATRDGRRHQAQPPQPTPTPPPPQTPPPPPRAKAAQAPQRIRTMAAAKQAVLQALRQDVPPPPDTLAQAVQWKKDHGLL